MKNESRYFEGAEAARLAAALRLALPRRIAQVIAAAGGEARIIGGAVRDILAGMDAADVQNLDMATTLAPEKAVAVLEAAGLKVIPTGLKHGTVTIEDTNQAGGQAVELTSLREDVTTDGRHAEVRFGADWREDAARRDFTINTMSIMPDGALYDPFGGLADLRARKLRFMGDAATRIREDYLRILRFFRFHARFGGGKPPDSDAMKAIAENATGLERISGERIAGELCGILAAKNPAVIAAMIEAGVDRAIAPNGFANADTAKLAKLFAQDDLPPIAALGFLIAPDDSKAVAARFNLSNRLTDILRFMGKPVDVIRLESNDWRKTAWYLMDEKRDARLLACRYILSCIRMGHAPKPAIPRRIKAWKKPPPPLAGKHLRAMGIPAGVELGRLLDLAIDIWVDSGFTRSRDALLRDIKEKHLP